MITAKTEPGGMMFGWIARFRFVTAIPIAASLLVVAGFSQSETPGRERLELMPERPQMAASDAVTLPADSPNSLQRKTRDILSWTPTEGKRLDFALKGVTRIVRFADLGLGNRMELVMPRESSAKWPIGTALKLRLGNEKTAVVTRIKLDTLPGPRAQGEGMLGIMGVVGDTLTGREIELARTMSSTGRMEFSFAYDRLQGATACCGLPVAFVLNRFGKLEDTLTVIFTFDPAMATYMVSIIGPIEGRTFPGFSYSMFRTERGEFHRELNEYPYTFKTPDSSCVNLYVGSRFRGRKSQLEPVLKAVLF